MQDPFLNRRKNDSVSLTIILLIVLISITYFLSVMTLPQWFYGLIGRTLWVSLVIILILRSISKFRTPGLKVALLIFFWSGFLILIVHLAFMDRPQIIQFMNDIQDHFGLKSLLICALLYIILLSVPFVPGIEIGLLIMAAFGKEGVISVYLATIIGLSLAYFIGSFFPQLWEKVGFSNLRPLVFSAEKEKSLTEAKPPIPRALKLFTSIAPWLLRYRYLSLALLINLPGNAIFGGGGGISFISGASGQFKWFWFISTLVLATLPVPLLIYFGLMEIEKLIQ